MSMWSIRRGLLGALSTQSFHTGPFPQSFHRTTSRIHVSMGGPPQSFHRMSFLDFSHAFVGRASIIVVIDVGICVELLCVGDYAAQPWTFSVKFCA